MKRKVTSFVLALAFIIPLASPAFAIDVVVSDQKLDLDQEPIIENGRTLIPMRAIFEALGSEVFWDNDTQTVTASKDENTISLQIGNQAAYLNDKQVLLDAPPKNVNGRTLVPIRFVAESLEASVEWYQNNETVYVNSQVPQAPKASFSEIQWVVDMYHYPRSENPVAGTWYHHEPEKGYYAAYDQYLFIKPSKSGGYDVIRAVYEPQYGALTIYTMTATYDNVLARLETSYESVYHYEGPPRGFIGAYRYQMRLDGNILINEYGWNELSEVPGPFNNWTPIYEADVFDTEHVRL